MFILKSAFCRVFQLAFRVALPVLPYRKPEILNSYTEIGKALKRKCINSLLIVTDKGIVASGLTDLLETVLKDNNVKYNVYDGVQPNPTVKNVEDAFRIYKENNCTCLIAIGGGSSIDCAKAVGAKVAYPKRTLEQMKGVMRILRRIPTVIAIPTTAGTGSEVTPVSIITDSEKNHKYALMSFPLIPHIAVLDATLTYSLPSHLTATTGIDVLTHAVEAYIGRSTTKETRALALNASKLVFENVKKAYDNGKNHIARENMLRAAFEAGVAFSKSYVGYIHALAHALGGQYGTPHGFSNAVIMPYVLEAYGKSIYKKLYKIAVFTEVCDKKVSHKEGAEKLIIAIKKLNESMGIPNKIDGIRKEDIPKMAYYAEKEANPLYPVPKLMTRKELEKFYYETGGVYEKN